MENSNKKQVEEDKDRVDLAIKQAEEENSITIASLFTSVITFPCISFVIIISIPLEAYYEPYMILTCVACMILTLVSFVWSVNASIKHRVIT